MSVFVKIVADRETFFCKMSFNASETEGFKSLTRRLTGDVLQHFFHPQCFALTFA